MRARRSPTSWSAQAVSALTLWKSWLDQGYAPNSVIGNTQTTSWQEFATGEYAFAENGTWQLQNAKKTGFEYGVIAVPGRTGGTAPAPTGGEFVTVPVQDDKDTETKAGQIVTCLTGPDRVLATDTALTYVSAVPAVQEQQVAALPELKVWVEAVRNAQGPHRRQPRHPLPADLATAVGRGAGGAHRCEDTGGGTEGRADRRGVREVAAGACAARRLGVRGSRSWHTCWCVTRIPCTPTST